MGEKAGEPGTGVSGDGGDFYRAVLDGAPWGAIVASTEIDGRCRYLNPEFTRITGYDLADVPTVADWIRLAYPDPDYRARVVANWEGDTDPTRMRRDVVYRVRCKDGTTRSIQFRAASLTGSLMVVMLLDVTDREQTARELRASEERYRQLVETSPFGIVVHVAGVVKFANPAAARIIGADSAEALLGRNAIEFVVPEQRASVAERIRRVLEDKLPAVTVEEQYLRLDGRRIDVEVFGSPVQYQGSVASQVVFNDITERKRMERERRELERRVQQTQRIESLSLLAGGVAHDMNNLLVGMLGHAELARRRGRDPERIPGHLDAIVDAAQRAAELAGQLLAFAGRRHLEFGLVDLDALVEQSRALLEAQIGRRAALELRAHGSLLPLQGDETQLRQVLVNLVGNAADAVEAAGRAGHITVSTGAVSAEDARLPGLWGDQPPEGRCVFLLVEDDGIGMDAATRQRIFDPFFTTRTDGRGLGLAAAAGIVRAHHGAIHVDSQRGEGTRFRVLFPAADHSGRSSVECHDGAAEAWRGSGTVLLVDDEEMVRDVGAEMIRSLGMEVVVARDGAEGVGRVAESPTRFVAAVVDLTMPDWSGVRTMRELRALRSDLPIVLSSGFDEDDTVSRLEDPPSAYLQKPYTVPRLVRALRRALG